jgi:acyl-CoA dehydrogenase
VRSLCILRETLARHDGLADFAFAMQGLGTGCISLFGTPEQNAEWLPLTRAGKALSAFALTEPASGSDVANMAMTATRDGNDFVLNGEKTWISNGGIADVYCVFARTGEGPGAKGLSAFIVPADTPGLEIAERLEVIAPHPLARLAFNDCRVPESAMIGKPGAGFKHRHVGARRVPFDRGRGRTRLCRRALDEALAACASGGCSARRCSICRWCRAISPTWRSTWMPRRCWSTARPGSRIRARRASAARRRWPSSMPPITRRR